MLACSHFVQVGSSDAKEVHVHGHMVKMRQSTKQNKTLAFCKKKMQKMQKNIPFKIPIERIC